MGMMNSRCGLSALTMVVSVVLGASTSAETITVKQGDDLQAAIDAAPDGQTIVVTKGLYAPIVLDGRTGLVLKGRGKPVIDGSTASNCILLTDCQDLAISGFVLKDSQLSAVLGNGCDTVTLSKCLVLDAGDEGIEFADCEKITIDRNTIDGTGDDGIALSDGSGEPTNNSVITRNKIMHVPDGGIDINGDNNVVSKNLVKFSEANGVLLQNGTGNEVTKNRLVHIDGIGIDIWDGGNTFSQNKIVQSTSHGIDVDADGNTLTKNVVTKAGQVGVIVRGESNQVTQNRISSSSTVDLQDTTGGATNTYVGNKVKTTEPPDLPNPKH